ncbi:IDEAL domain-containing protein [Domibacillus robiginosus]|uniref:IDEAL domain-containing protein n=1 Tax=Domibacillus robiginosus TaxID=1071054 RepID=UPI00067C2231|nr:IDEAL domain-containing protein [Domibacillus robiginosus]
MLNIGDWKIVKIGSMTVVGYVSNTIHYSLHSERVELTKVVWIKDNQYLLKKPSPGIFTEEQLEPIGDFWDKHQDNSTLIDLALKTGDREWFKELTGEKRKWHTVEQ